MDETARRIDPAPLRALLRCRVLREDDAKREVQRLMRARARAGERERQAEADAERHEATRREREAGMIAAMVDHAQSLPTMLKLRGQVEEMAETAVRLAAERVRARRECEESEARLANGRAALHHRLRETQKWRKTIDRAADARRAHEEAAAELELEDELSDRARHASPTMVAGD